RSIDVAVRNAIAFVTLNRPEVHNAFDEALIAELTQALRALGADGAVRAVVLLGAGASFCAGADLKWMEKMARFSKAQNLAGAHAARRYFLSAERFSAAEAFRLGLLHDLAQIAELDERIDELLGSLLTAGPRAQAECKALIRAVAHRPIGVAMIAETAARIAKVRTSSEAKEGVAAFLGKRRAAWVPR